VNLRSIHRGAAPIALAVVLTFGCSTVRVPASTMGTEVAVGEDGPEPQVELWLESGAPVSEPEKARAAAEVKAALERASQTLVSEDGEALLVVRAQGIARTASRKSDQQAAKVGIAVGAVAVVAVIVVAIVASGGKGGGGHGGGAPRVGGARIAPRVPRVAVPVPRFRMPVVATPHTHTPVVVGIHADVVGSAPAPDDAATGLVAVSPMEEPSASAGSPARPAVEPVTLRLPPPRPLDLTKRKFFDKDLTRLELIVVDRGSGEPTWMKTVEGKVDPRSVEAVRSLLAAAIEDRGGWVEVRLPAAE
jgi:hypothetical protein